MKWFYHPPTDVDRAEQDDDDSPPVLFGLPSALLERHGGRILRPTLASAVAGYPPPRPTVYRARTLLVPDYLQQDAGFFAGVNSVLALIGMELVSSVESAAHDPGPDHGDARVFADLQRLPRPAVLIPVAGYRHPVEVDAWTALQTLRAATVRDERDSNETHADSPGPELDHEIVEQIELEHLLIGSPITGSPIGETGGGLAGNAGGSSDGGGPGITSSYLFSGGDPRTPVAVLLDPPARAGNAECASRYGRRPVVAVLDTGHCAHWWLDQDGFVATDTKIQDAVRKESERAAADGDKPRQVIAGAQDSPVTDNPLVGELNSALGHSTFISGIVRQVAPDARVLAVRIMHSDDIAYEGDIICALGHLAKRIALADRDDPVAQVDIVSLSFGYFSESHHGKAAKSGLWQAIRTLLSLGVVVFAAAGNSASSRRFYPAAFALESVPAGQVPVFSVGALNPNGTKAVFSNDGHWVTAWAAGACVISTYPTDIDASRTPQLRMPGNRRPAGQWPPGREALDPNDYSGGFAVWSGTSFAGPYGAALFARQLLKVAESGLSLSSLETAARTARAVAAYGALPRRIN